jgi:hypothetical protein
MRIKTGIQSLLCLLIASVCIYAVDFTTLDRKVLFGYQGWFDCPGVWGGSWNHWSIGNNTPNPTSVKGEMYPDLTEFSLKDLYPVTTLTINGKPACFYSNNNPAIADMHFKWMRDYGIDGVMVQRFLHRASSMRNSGDKVLVNIIAAAEKYGRTFAIEYDVTGASKSSFTASIKKDWQYLVETRKVTSSPNYLRHKGKPLVSVWGMGLEGGSDTWAPSTPEEAIALVTWFKTGAEPNLQTTFMGGVGAYWRTLSGDCATTNQKWLDYYKSCDILQPWNIGRFTTLSAVSSNFKKRLVDDKKTLDSAGIIYMPSIFPGFSWSRWNSPPSNKIPRLGGDFIWQQAYQAASAGIRTLKIAMFDEIDEATAMYKLAPNEAARPKETWFLTLDADGLSLPSDWYLRLGGVMTQTMHGTGIIPPVIPIKPNDPWVFPATGVVVPVSKSAGVSFLSVKKTPAGISFSGLKGIEKIRILDLKGSCTGEMAVNSDAALLTLGKAPSKGTYLFMFIGSRGTIIEKIAL